MSRVISGKEGQGSRVSMQTQEMIAEDKEKHTDTESYIHTKIFETKATETEAK